MISTCPQCHNYDCDKLVSEDKKTVTCPKCGYQWTSKGLPLFILTGCSGVGKTTTAIELLGEEDLIVLDADYFTFMPSVTMEDWISHIERMHEISADIMQSGKPVLWTMAGCIDHLHNNYFERFFDGIYCLALVCSDEALEQRMREGRNIQDEEWIQSSKEYNQYLATHDTVGTVKIESLDITEMSAVQRAEYVFQWVKRKLIGGKSDECL